MGAKSLGDGKKRPLAREREIIRKREQSLTEGKEITFMQQRRLLDLKWLKENQPADKAPGQVNIKE